MNILVPGHPADGRFAAERAAMCAIDDPLQHAHVLAIAGPDELSFGVLTEPVHVEDARSLAEALCILIQ